MAYEYKWEITGLKKTSAGDVPGAIVGTQWKVTAIDEDGNEGTFAGATPFKLEEIDSNTFTAYEDLTKEQVIGWIQNTVSGSNGYWPHISEQIEKQLSAKKNVIEEVGGSALPWEEGENTYSPPSGSI